MGNLPNLLGMFLIKIKSSLRTIAVPLKINHIKYFKRTHTEILGKICLTFLN